MPPFRSPPGQGNVSSLPVACLAIEGLFPNFSEAVPASPSAIRGDACFRPPTPPQYYTMFFPFGTQIFFLFSVRSAKPSYPRPREEPSFAPGHERSSLFRTGAVFSFAFYPEEEPAFFPLNT